MQIQAMLTGKLYRDPEMHYTPAGKPITKFSLPSVVYDYSTKTDETQWVNIAVFGDRAEHVSKYCKKGTIVTVQGDLKFRQYVDKENKSRVSLDLTAKDVHFISGFGSQEVREGTAYVPSDDPNNPF